jgi:hypothetical protein
MRPGRKLEYVDRSPRGVNGYRFGWPSGGSMHEYDKSSKWLIEHHGDSILRLAGVRDIVAWKPLPADLVQSRRLPDGVIEAI